MSVWSGNEEEMCQIWHGTVNYYTMLHTYGDGLSYSHTVNDSVTSVKNIYNGKSG